MKVTAPMSRGCWNLVGVSLVAFGIAGVAVGAAPARAQVAGPSATRANPTGGGATATTVEIEETQASPADRGPDTVIRPAPTAPPIPPVGAQVPSPTVAAPIQTPGPGVAPATGTSAPVSSGAPATPVPVTVRAGVETAAPSAAAGVPAQIRFRNDVGDAFKLVGAEFLLDGQPIRVSGATPDALEAVRDMPVYAGQLAPGAHVITTRLQYQGRRRGPFSYVEAYRFNVENTGGFVVPSEGGGANFTVVTRERRGLNLPADRRLDVQVERSE